MKVKSLSILSPSGGEGSFSIRFSVFSKSKIQVIKSSVHLWICDFFSFNFAGSALNNFLRLLVFSSFFFFFLEHSEKLLAIYIFWFFWYCNLLVMTASQVILYSRMSSIYAEIWVNYMQDIHDVGIDWK